MHWWALYGKIQTAMAYEKLDKRMEARTLIREAISQAGSRTGF